MSIRNEQFIGIDKAKLDWSDYEINKFVMKKKLNIHICMLHNQVNHTGRDNNDDCGNHTVIQRHTH